MDIELNIVNTKELQSGKVYAIEFPKEFSPKVVQMYMNNLYEQTQDKDITFLAICGGMKIFENN